jgi:uncharacterized lipoprotein YehR (DUF1307 family)
MKRFIKILIPILIVVLSLMACGSSDNTGKLASGTPGNTPTTTKHFKKGDTVEVGNKWKVIVNDVTSNTGDDINKPSKGAYLIINVSLTNISDKEQNISSLLNFKLKGPDKTEYTETIVINMPNVDSAPNGKVAAGDGTKGSLVYDVPADAKSFTFYFESSLLSSGQTIWDLNI